ncbi:MAG: hypothetical protein N2379_11025, partial [Verrucomicrobiae bacterium]|nr:hypothetical protein [Verrucomicrobiae bacterium]
MNKKRVWFPGWAEVLAHEPWPASQREAYRRVTARYLHECKERRWAVNVASARRFIETVEQERKPPAEKLAAWKEALNWFFKVARESGAQKDSTPHPPAHL